MASPDAIGNADDLKSCVLSFAPDAKPSIRPYYSKIGDFVSFCWVPDEPFFARRVDEFLTSYHSMKTQQIVGCKIKGVSYLFAEMTKRLRIQSQRPTICGLTVAGRGLASDPAPRERYEPIWASTENVEIDDPDLVPA